MDSRDAPTEDGTPEDVAALFAWAGLQGARYRDYSASRREQRAQARYRAAKDLLARELEAQTKDGAPVDETAGERLETARRVETAARAAWLALREEREVAEAHASAKQKEQVYEQAELRRRTLAGPQPHGSELGEAGLMEDEREAGMGLGALAAIEMAGKETETAGTETKTGGDVLRAEAPARPAWLTSAKNLRSEDDADAGWRGEEPAGARAESGLQTTERTEARTEARAAERPIGDTLQESRELVASRWAVLKGLLGPSIPALPLRGPRGPVVAIASLAGGVGKTSLTAAMARAFASQGERVLLVETAAHGLLGFHFGMRDLRPGAAPTTVAREGESGAVSLVAYDIADVRDELQQGELAERLMRDGEGCTRLVLDLASESIWLVRLLAHLRPLVLAPVAPDLNSVVGVREMERIFGGFADPDGRPLLPFYVLNRFDAGLPLHLDIREVLRLQLGERLLPAAVRSSPVVSESLAEGRTVAEYAPEAPVARDYAEVARWLKGMSAEAVDGIAVERRGDR